MAHLDPHTRVWLEKSKVRLRMYHATAAQVDFDSFDTSKGDLGAHFGTLEQAHHVAASRLGMGEFVRIIPVWLQLKNPLRLKDVGTFHSDGIAVQLEKKGMLPKGEGKRIEKEVDQNWRLRKVYDPMLLEIIKDRGFDGIIYANTQEGSGDSYIVFETDKIKFALSPEAGISQSRLQNVEGIDPDERIEECAEPERERARSR